MSALKVDRRQAAAGRRAIQASRPAPLLRTERLGYIADLVGQLRRMAKRAQANELARLLAEAEVEARRLRDESR